MKQLSKHDVNKLTAKQLQKQLPFQIVSDNEVIAVVLPMKDMMLRPSPTKDLPDLPFSKHRQAKNLLGNTLGNGNT